jgi:hypothetical protein
MNRIWASRYHNRYNRQASLDAPYYIDFLKSRKMNNRPTGKSISTGAFTPSKIASLAMMYIGKKILEAAEGPEVAEMDGEKRYRCVLDMRARGARSAVLGEEAMKTLSSHDTTSYGGEDGDDFVMCGCTGLRGEREEPIEDAARYGKGYVLCGLDTDKVGLRIVRC